MLRVPQSARAFLEGREGFAAAGRRASPLGGREGWKLKAAADETFSVKEKIKLGLRPSADPSLGADSVSPSDDSRERQGAKLGGGVEDDGAPSCAASTPMMEDGASSGSSGIALGAAGTHQAEEEGAEKEPTGSLEGDPGEESPRGEERACSNAGDNERCNDEADSGSGVADERSTPVDWEKGSGASACLGAATNGGGGD